MDPDGRTGAGFRLERWGRASWSAVGIILLAVLVEAGLGALSGIVIPIVVAAIIGVVVEPLVDVLRRWRVPNALAAIIGAGVTVLALAVVVLIVVYGVLGQLSDITTQMLDGWTSLIAWLNSLDLDAEWLAGAYTAVSDAVPQIGMGALGLISSTVYGAVSIAVGLFFAIFFLFFILRDGAAFTPWLARITHRDPAVVALVDAQVRSSLRGYFRGVALTALITAPIFIIPLLLLRVPLVVPIAIIYLLLSFVPFVGAWITAAFAVLIAFGSGGASAALIVGLALLISNGTVQSVVSSWALGSSLRIHPLAVLLATLVGGSIAGILGMVLGAPLVAAVRGSVAAVGRARAGDAGTSAAI